MDFIGMYRVWGLGFPKIMGTCLGFPRIRIVSLGGLYWVPLFWGSATTSMYQIGIC